MVYFSSSPPPAVTAVRRLMSTTTTDNYLMSSSSPPRVEKQLLESQEQQDQLPFVVGEVVYVNGEGDWRGRICYIGDVHFAKGEWAGVALDHPLGNHDGGVGGGPRYFQCGADRGIFVRLRRLSRRALIPQSLDPHKIGLHRASSPAARNICWRRETSPVTSIASSSGGGGGSGSWGGSRGQSQSSRESSPFATSYHNHRLDRSESPDLRRGSKSPSPSSPLLHLGDRVIVASSVGETKTGILRYVGPVAFAEGQWAGIQLFHPLGKNDGTVRGRQYFECEHPYGLFVPLAKVVSSPANNKAIHNRKLGTRDNLGAISRNGGSGSGSGRGDRAGSYDEYY